MTIDGKYIADHREEIKQYILAERKGYEKVDILNGVYVAEDGELVDKSLAESLNDYYDMYDIKVVKIIPEYDSDYGEIITAYLEEHGHYTNETAVFFADTYLDEDKRGAFWNDVKELVDFGSSVSKGDLCDIIYNHYTEIPGLCVRLFDDAFAYFYSPDRVDKMIDDAIRAFDGKEA